MWEAVVQSPDGLYDNTPVTWTVTLSYTSSGGKGPFIGPSLDFSTMSAMSGQSCASNSLCYSNVFSSVGGQLMTAASATASNPPSQPTQLSCPVSFNYTTYVTGPQKAVPQSEIVAMLISLYTSLYTTAVGMPPPTPNLLTGIAWHESRLEQFKSITLYGTKAPWPIENPPDVKHNTVSGAFIGIMQVPNGMSNAFDWKMNEQSGADLFVNMKLQQFTIGMESRLRTLYSGLPALTPTQREDVAIGYYYGVTSKDTEQTWTPFCTGIASKTTCSGGVWQWIFNTANDRLETNFVTSVRAHLQ